MILFAILNNMKDKKFIECVAAKNSDEVLKYCDKKYGEQSQPIALNMSHDTKGNLVQIEVYDLVKEKYRK